MSVVQDLQSRLTQAMKSQNATEKDILRVVLGEISRFQGENPTDDEKANRIIRKVLEGNIETLHLMKKNGRDDENVRNKLESENTILKQFLPKNLDQEQIKALLLPMKEQLRSAKSEGMAIGIAIKYLRQNNFPINAIDVQAVIKEFRS